MARGKGPDDANALAQIMSHDIQTNGDEFGALRSGYIEVLGPLVKLVFANGKYRIGDIVDEELDWQEAFQIVEKARTSRIKQEFFFDTAEQKDWPNIWCLGINSKSVAGNSILLARTGEQNTFVRVGVARLDINVFQGYGTTLVKIV